MVPTVPRLAAAARGQTAAILAKSYKVKKIAHYFIDVKIEFLMCLFFLGMMHHSCLVLFFFKVCTKNEKRKPVLSGLLVHLR